MTSDPRLTPARNDLAAAHLEGQVPSERFVHGQEMTVCVPVLDLALTPDRSAALATQLLFGEAFTAYETDAGSGLAWGQMADGYVGYVAMSGLESPSAPATHQVRAVSTHIYPAPNIKSRPLDELPSLARVSVVEMDQSFARLVDGGFVPSVHLAPLGVLDPDPVGFAEQFLGAPYLWGGRSPGGLDCSALVQLAFAASGASLLRDSDMQETDGQPIDEQNLRRGDLVFWRGHVGIMRDEATFLHANAHHMAVAIEPLAEAKARIAKAGEGPVTACRRISLQP